MEKEHRWKWKQQVGIGLFEDPWKYRCQRHIFKYGCGVDFDISSVFCLVTTNCSRLVLETI